MCQSVIPFPEEAAVTVLCAHLVHDEVPGLSCCGDFVWIFPLQKADGSTLRVCCLRQNMDFHWTRCSSFSCQKSQKDQIAKDVLVSFSR